MPTEFEPRSGPTLWVQTPCLNCECPPSRVKWVAALCPSFIVGQVLDAGTGDPIQGVSLSAEGLETDSFAEAVSDALGRFKLGPLEVEDGYTIVASGLEHSYRLWERVALPEQGLARTVPLVRTGNVQGVVRDANGVAVANATVLLMQEDNLRWGEGETTTDAMGRYCFCRVDVGAESGRSLYSLLVLHPEYSFAQGQVWVASGYSSADVAPLVMPLKSSIQGVVKVNGNAHEGVLVSVCADQQGLPLEDLVDVTDAQGHFSIKVDGNNIYRLLAQDDETDVADQEVFVAPGQNVSPQPEINLRGPGSIAGTVRNASGQGVAGLIIEVSLQGAAEGDDAVVSSVVSVSGGSYYFDRVLSTPPNQLYIVRAWQAVDEEYTFFAQATDVIVTPDMETLVNLQSTIY